MKKLVRCKVCGFIIQEGKLKDKCPACGVQRTAFEPYTPDISEKRKKILDLDLHPVIVHFPQAFGVLIFILAILTLIFPLFFPNQFRVTIQVLSGFLPFVVLGAMLSGMLDGKTRFKKLTTSHLKKKIAFGSIFLAFSIVIVFISAFLINTLPGLIIVLIFSFGCVVCGSILGLIGKSLLNAAFKGK